MAVTPHSSGWLATDQPVERLQLDDATWVDVARGLVPRGDEVHATLVDAVTWQQGQVFRYERYIDSPRQMASCPAGTHPAIDAMSEWLRERYRARFGSPALALYRDERDSVAFHRDRELRWLDDTVIAVLTFGARRPWLMKPITGRRNDLDDDVMPGHRPDVVPGHRPDPDNILDFSPGSGDLLVMGGAAQARWLHAVPKVRGRSRSRISVQWRFSSRRGRRDTNPSFYAPRYFSKK